MRGVMGVREVWVEGCVGVREVWDEGCDGCEGGVG